MPEAQKPDPYQDYISSTGQLYIASVGENLHYEYYLYYGAMGRLKCIPDIEIHLHLR